jgi:hypothetical protein
MAAERVPSVFRWSGEGSVSVLQRLYRDFMAEFARPLGLAEVDAVLTVILFRRRPAYQGYCRQMYDRCAPPSIPGLYEMTRRRTVVLDEGQGSQGILRHEATHQLMHLFAEYRPLQSPWLQEGLPAYFETDRAGENNTRQALLRDASLLPLEAFLDMTPENLWCDSAPTEQGSLVRRAEQWYAQSWGLVTYLMRHHRRMFHAFMVAEFAGKGGAKTFGRLLKEEAGLDPTAFEAHFRAFLKKLESR